MAPVMQNRLGHATPTPTTSIAQRRHTSKELLAAQRRARPVKGAGVQIRGVFS